MAVNIWNLAGWQVDGCLFLSMKYSHVEGGKRGCDEMVGSIARDQFIITQPLSEHQTLTVL